MSRHRTGIPILAAIIVLVLFSPVLAFQMDISLNVYDFEVSLRPVIDGAPVTPQDSLHTNKVRGEYRFPVDPTVVVKKDATWGYGSSSLDYQSGGILALMASGSTYDHSLQSGSLWSQATAVSPYYGGNNFHVSQSCSPEILFDFTVPQTGFYQFTLTGAYNFSRTVADAGDLPLLTGAQSCARLVVSFDDYSAISRIGYGMFCIENLAEKGNLDVAVTAGVLAYTGEPWLFAEGSHVVHVYGQIFQNAQAVHTPVPAAGVLFGSGLLGLLARRWRRR